ncbi:M48 family metallopeptidase [Bifidobacterium leontopitheci]|uniref:YgjP-like metallopeptidase domain-containing protein n=1 Tax=Bifidobacterium leontopitheci TaxID=2650774 RepID=A0A6I1GF25_9BIFI|nr:SprT family zinc-dependent metalloprotease [Bifidobacterium leontopitheci]KAB7790145.1 hypothetical protein F7D09_1338 [Bifidobacterium leontopitheci]
MPNHPSAQPARRPAAAPASQPAVLEVDGLTLHVTRKPIRNLYLRIKPPTGRIEVSAPKRMSDRHITEFARERHDWIIRQRQRMVDDYTRSMRELSALSPSGQSSPAGRAIHNPAADRPNPNVAPDRAAIWTDERKHQAADAINAALPALLAKWTPVIGRSPSRITLRIMTSRWGSCTPKTGRIRLNLQLGLMDPRFLEYVLVHEMTHLWASGHGAEFQRRMSLYLPDWRRLRRELNRHVVW